MGRTQGELTLGNYWQGEIVMGRNCDGAKLRWRELLAGRSHRIPQNNLGRSVAQKFVRAVLKVD